MGAGFSASDKKRGERIERIVDEMLVSHESVGSVGGCMAHYSIVLGSEIKKMKKVDVSALKDEVFFVPDSAAKHARGAMVTKREMCEKLADHYAGAMTLFRAVKAVYASSSTLWESVERSLEFDRRALVRVRAFVNVDDDLLVTMPGLADAVEMFDSSERGAFANGIRLALGASSALRDATACGDTLFSPTEYAAALPALESPEVSRVTGAACVRYRESALRSDDFWVREGVVSPIAGTGAVRKTYRIADPKRAAKALAEMRRRYSANLARVERLVAALVETLPSGEVRLRHMPHARLAQMVAEAKRVVARHYLETLHDFSHLRQN